MREFYQVVRALRRALPGYRFQVRRLKLPRNTYGLCEQRASGDFLIRIQHQLNQDLAIQIFLHELAHVLSWGESPDVHDAPWGIAYSRVYKLYLSEYIGQET